MNKSHCTGANSRISRSIKLRPIFTQAAKWHFLPSPSSCDENVYSPSVHNHICVCLYQPQSYDIRFCLAIGRKINIIIGFLNELMARFTPFVAHYTLNLLKWLRQACLEIVSRFPPFRFLRLACLPGWFSEIFDSSSAEISPIVWRKTNKITNFIIAA